MKKKVVLVIAEKNQLGILTKWIKEETGMKTKRFNIHKGFPSAEGVDHVFTLIPTTIKINSVQFKLFTNPHMEEDFFYDKNVWIEFNFINKEISKLENKFRAIFRTFNAI